MADTPLISRDASCSVVHGVKISIAVAWSLGGGEVRGAGLLRQTITAALPSLRYSGHNNPPRYQFSLYSVLGELITLGIKLRPLFLRG